MSSDCKLDSVSCEDPEFDSISNTITFGKRGSLVYKILNGILKQGNRSFINVATNAVRSATINRFSRSNRATFRDDVNVGNDEDEQRVHGFEKKSGPLLSGMAYCISSCSMILLNKIVLSSYGFNAGISLMFYQNLISIAVVIILRLFGVVSIEKLTWKLIRIWLPVNMIFVGMLVTGMYSLKYMNIAMVTILKNMTNIMTAVGELYIFKKHQNQKVWTAMLLMIISAVSGGITDLSFDSVGYTWQIMNCVLTASYSLTLRRVMDKAKQLTRSGSLNEVSMVLLNNALSLPFAIFLILLFGEWKYVYNVDVVRLPLFWVVATASGLLGLAISFTSMWFLNQTSPTTYSLVGSLNKIPISVAGVLLFNVPVFLLEYSLPGPKCPESTLVFFIDQKIEDKISEDKQQQL
ncbi:Gdp-mannose transporter like [Thalictrum thalictroides]|uniref:Gdp-mannose transporter like n=1 Tax=Thalictrum thalictroides TaxID=46969 RepID=A0A7J6X878_THATH|nr:Gdp-mannose transporter like [Thalictrum thalictroides]